MISSGGQSGKATERAGNKVFRSSRLLGNDVHAGKSLCKCFGWVLASWNPCISRCFPTTPYLSFPFGWGLTGSDRYWFGGSFGLSKTVNKFHCNVAKMHLYKEESRQIALLCWECCRLPFPSWSKLTLTFYFLSRYLERLVRSLVYLPLNRSAM